MTFEEATQIGNNSFFGFIEVNLRILIFQQVLQSIFYAHL